MQGSQTANEQSTPSPASGRWHRPIATFVVPAVGIVVALWATAGHALFGIGGPLAPVYVMTIGFLLGVLHVFTGLAYARAARNGLAVRRSVWAVLLCGWACGVGLGLTIVDITPVGLQSVISGAEEPLLGLAIGLSNPFGIITIVLAVVALVLANRDARPRSTEDLSDEDAAAHAPAHPLASPLSESAAQHTTGRGTRES